MGDFSRRSNYSGGFVFGPEEWVMDLYMTGLVMDEIVDTPVHHAGIQGVHSQPGEQAYSYRSHDGKTPNFVPPNVPPSES